MVINPRIEFYIPIIRIPIKGGITIPNIATFDHGTYSLWTNRRRHDSLGLFGVRHFVSCFFFRGVYWYMVGNAETHRRWSFSLVSKRLKMQAVFRYGNPFFQLFVPCGYISPVATHFGVVFVCQNSRHLFFWAVVNHGRNPIRDDSAWWS